MPARPFDVSTLAAAARPVPIGHLVYLRPPKSDLRSDVDSAQIDGSAKEGTDPPFAFRDRASGGSVG
jgi:hypothetical protein